MACGAGRPGREAPGAEVSRVGPARPGPTAAAPVTRTWVFWRRATIDVCGAPGAGGRAGQGRGPPGRGGQHRGGRLLGAARCGKIRRGAIEIVWGVQATAGQTGGAWVHQRASASPLSFRSRSTHGGAASAPRTPPPGPRRPSAAAHAGSRVGAGHARRRARDARGAGGGARPEAARQGRFHPPMRAGGRGRTPVAHGNGPRFWPPRCTLFTHASSRLPNTPHACRPNQPLTTADTGGSRTPPPHARARAHASACARAWLHTAAAAAARGSAHKAGRRRRRGGGRVALRSPNMRAGKALTPPPPRPLALPGPPPSPPPPPPRASLPGHRRLPSPQRCLQRFAFAAPVCTERECGPPFGGCVAHACCLQGQ
jgi:hypothetical protein